MAKYVKTEQGYIDASIFALAQFKPEGKSYLTFSSPKRFTLKVNDSTKHWGGTLEYFAYDKTWTVWDGKTTLSAIADHGRYLLYLRGTGNKNITSSSINSNWVLTGSDIVCIGNIENLLNYATVESGNHPTMFNACYQHMFFGCTALTQAPALPATTLTSGCYNQMFTGCTALTHAPALPATTLASTCYYGMFSGCIALTQAPALPATTLATGCYSDMFRGCTSLTHAPALPATTLNQQCYYGMFSGCIALTQAPALPATTLDQYCYSYMFNGCTSLKLSYTKTDEYTQEYRIPTAGIGTRATDALTNMFASTGGTFTGTPAINTTYYLSTDNMIVRDTEVATLNGYVGSMIDDDAIDKYNGMTPVECVFPPLFDGDSESSRIFYVKQGVINPVDYKTVTDDIKTAWINLTFLTDATSGNLSSYRNTIKCIAPLIEIGVFGEDFFNTVTWDSSCVFFDDPITQSKKITIWTSSASTKSFGINVDGPKGYYASDSYSILNDEFNGNGIVRTTLCTISNYANDTSSKLGQLEMEAAPTKDMQIATKKYVDDAIGKYADTAEYIIPSSTQGSTKKFKITVDDSGAITTTEVM